MALTLETTSRTGVFVPSGATIPATSIVFSGDTIKVKGITQLAAAPIDDAASATTAFTALVAALDTYISGTYVPNVLKLDTALTINMICTLVLSKRGRDQSDQYIEGTEVYIVNFEVEYQ